MSAAPPAHDITPILITLHTHYVIKSHELAAAARLDECAAEIAQLALRLVEGLFALTDPQEAAARSILPDDEVAVAVAPGKPVRRLAVK